MNILNIDNISKRYNNHQALTDISLEIPNQSIFGLLGPNGAGKTTLIRIINQIIRQDKGKLLFEDKILNEDHIKEIGYLPEERGLYKKMKVGEQLIFFGQMRGLSRKEAKKRSLEWCEKLKIIESWSSKVEDLSKGMAQKIQFITTIIHQPRLIILDEPFSGFDPVNVNLITREIFKLREQGATIIFSTHRMESVEQLCDHVALINKSYKILDGLKKEIKNQFKKGKYIIEYQGNINQTKSLKILQSTDEKEHKTAVIQSSSSDDSPNNLLKEIIQQVDILSFKEHTPDMNEIFISLVDEKIENHQ